MKDQPEILTPFNPLAIARKLSMMGLLGGAIAGTVAIGLFLAFSALGTNPWLSPSKPFVFDGGIVFLLVVFLLLFVRLGRRPQVLKLWEGLLMGSVAVLTCALVSATLILLLGDNILADELTEYKLEMNRYYGELLEDQLQKKEQIIQNNSVKYYEVQIETLKAQVKGLAKISPLDMFMDEFFKKCFFGFFIVPIISLVLRRK